MTKRNGLWNYPVDDGLVLCRSDVNGLFLLNQSARWVWNESQRGTLREEMISTFAAHFGISSEIARRDVEATLASWDEALLAPAHSRQANDVGLHPELSQISVTDWPEVRAIDCTVNGRPLRVFLELGDVWDEIAPRLQPLRTNGETPPEHTFTVGCAGDSVLVLRDGICIAKEETAAVARVILLQALVSLGEPAAILHAGGCGGILLAGHTHSGKSTLCAALMARGLPFHCEDSAVLDRDFRFAPMPFPLMLRHGSWPVLEARFPELKDAPVYQRFGVDVRFLTPVQPSGPATVTALVFVEHDAAAETQITEVSVFDSLLELQRSGFWVEHTREGIERFLGWLARIRRYKLIYAELEQAEGFILELSDPPRP